MLHSVFKIFLIVLFLTFAACSSTRPVSEEKTEAIYLADPTVLYHKGTYYLYGTVGANADSGFLVYTSSDMKLWKASKEVNDGYALKKGDAYGTAGFWAPQVFFYNKKFYMAYVANERIAIAESQSPLGPFTQTIKQPLAAPVNQIDPFVFIDDDGKKYLYHVRLTSGNKIFVAEMTDDLSAIKPETLRECITAGNPWENTASAPWSVTEGPSIIKHNNLYYLFYTANDFRNIDYATGYAVSDNPYGPWKKYIKNPILTRSVIGINGTGHGDFVINKKNKRTYYVFHTHNSGTAVLPRRTGMVEVEFTKDDSSSVDKLAVLPNTFTLLKLKKE